MKKYISIDEQQEIWQRVTLLHSGQTYGGATRDLKVEYINHIASVAFEVSNALQYTDSMDGDLAIKCALLHDTLEDTGFTVAELTQLYGEKVAAGVQALTKNNNLPKEERMIDSILRIQQQPREIWAVKMADRICNLYAPPYYWNEAKKASYREEAMVIYTHLSSGNEYLAKRLLDKISAYAN
jgi:(p)ppGpp synthase/HD superfamily hydrolase